MTDLPPSQTPLGDRATSLPSPPKTSALPHSISPMLAQSTTEPFDSDRHIFELKWDGIRALAFVDGSGMRLQGRGLQDITPMFPELQGIGETVTGLSAVLDGEIIALDSQGKSSFQLLQERVAPPGWKPRPIGGTPAIRYLVFDLLYLNGTSLLNQSLWRRKRLLHETVQSTERVQVCEFISREGVAFYQAAWRHRQEGIIAKNRFSPYLPGRRSHHWLKIRAERQGAFVIGGYTVGERYRRKLFGSLLLGLYQGKELHYVGSVEGGFTEEVARQLLPILEALQQPHCPFLMHPRIPRLLYWCEPRLVCQVKHGEWSQDRQLRFPMFHVLRLDKPPSDCTFEAFPPASR